MKTRSWLLILFVALAMALASACAPTGGDAEPDTGDDVVVIPDPVEPPEPEIKPLEVLIDAPLAAELAKGKAEAALTSANGVAGVVTIGRDGVTGMDTYNANKGFLMRQQEIIGEELVEATNALADLMRPRNTRMRKIMQPSSTRRSTMYRCMWMPSKATRWMPGNWPSRCSMNPALSRYSSRRVMFRTMLIRWQRTLSWLPRKLMMD